MFYKKDRCNFGATWINLFQVMSFQFVLSISARGLVCSTIANYSVSQSKISYEAIKYYDKNLKFKSKPLLYGKNTLSKSSNKKNLHFFMLAHLNHWQDGLGFMKVTMNMLIILKN